MRFAFSIALVAGVVAAGSASVDPFGPEQQVLAELPGLNDLDVADFDGDGDLDVVGCGFGLAWAENTDAAGTFGDSRAIPLGPGITPQYVVAADFDGDGDSDVAWSALTAGVAWQRNTDGLGSFGPPIQVSASLVFAMEASDLDGDGDPDLLVSNSSSLVWHENLDGMGSFSSSRIVAPSIGVSESVAVADLDGDGDQDALFCRYFSVEWCENTDGAGCFGPSQVITTDVMTAVGVSAADIDGDGDQDVLSASQGDGKVAWYENMDGTGTFGTQTLIGSQAMATTAVAADVNGDGDLDVLSCSAGELGNVAWYEGLDGVGTFGGQQVIGAVPGSKEMLWADLSGDGLGDAVVAGDRRIVWFKSEACSLDLPSLEVVRLGSPPNPRALRGGASGGPLICSAWSPVIDHSTFMPGAVTDVLVVAGGPANRHLGRPGTLLCDLSATPWFRFRSAPSVPFAIVIPPDCRLVGLSFSAQGASFDGTKFLLTNALDITIGTF